MARALFRPPTLGRRTLKTGNRKWADFPRPRKPTSQVGFSGLCETGPFPHVPDRGTSRQKKMHFALSQFRSGFAERCKHTR